jgi:hypothetical protein
MATYEVAIPDNTPGVSTSHGHDVMFVEAASGADAIAIAQGQYRGARSASFAAAVATEVTVAADLSPVTNVAGEVIPFTLTVSITGDDTNETFSYEAAATDSYADVFDAMVILLNAHADIAGAAFGSNLLTVAAIGDGIGDHTLTATFTYGDGPTIPSFLSTVVHEGIAGAVLTVATNASVVLPTVYPTQS